MDKINWINGQNGGTPLSAENLNLMQENIETAIYEVDENAKPSVITASMSGNHTLASASSYEQIVLDSSVSTKNNLSISSDGGILIGKGINKVLISVKGHFQTVAGTSLKWVSVFDQYANPLCAVASSLSARATLTSTPAVVNVKEGDVLYLKVSGALGDIVRGTDAYTNITVEAVG